MTDTSKAIHIPDDFVRTQTEVNGAAGIEWLDRLPALIVDCERRWSLTVGPPFLPLSYNYAAPAVRADGIPAVLKVCYPTPAFSAEVAALRLFDGRGAVQALESDLDQGVLLLERLEPGTRLRTMADAEAVTSIAVAVMRQLWRPAPADHSLTPLSDWVAGLGRLRQMFGGTSGPFPAGLVDEAERLFAELIASMGEPVVLHGDLHHDNILAAQRQPWLAIDPKGLVGEAEYETACWIQNTIPDDATPEEATRIVGRCVDQLAEELGFDRERIRGWLVAQAVLGAFWIMEDHGHGWEPAVAGAEILAAIKA